MTIKFYAEIFIGVFSSWKYFLEKKVSLQNEDKLLENKFITLLLLSVSSEKNLKSLAVSSRDIFFNDLQLNKLIFQCFCLKWANKRPSEKWSNDVFDFRGMNSESFLLSNASMISLPSCHSFCLFLNGLRLLLRKIG